MTAERDAPPVAAIDCGTNSLRLLLAEPGPDGGLIEVLRRTEIVRLGQGVDATGAFADKALTRTFVVLEEYAAVLADAGVAPDRTRMVATSAARDVSNREAFLAGVRARIGVEPEVITGDREARLSFVGALSSATVRAQLAPVLPILVVDIGGGSTELVLGDRDGRVDSAGSLPMGSVRLTERFFTAGRPTAADLVEATAYVDELLDNSDLDLSGVGSAVGVAGTVVTLVWLSGATSDPRQVAGALLLRERLDSVLARLSAMSAEEIRAIPGMHPGRADVITAGALIAARIAARLPTPGLVVSIADILDGLALEILGSHLR